jgi:hypothetical protein
VHANLVITNANVYTVDATRSRAEAVAIVGGRIAALGTAADIESLTGPDTRVVDAGGRLVLPGFIDAHMHTSQAAQSLYGAALGGLMSVDACLDALARYAAAHPDLPVIRGFGWPPDVVPRDRLLASEIDAIVADRPVVLFDDGYHLGWVNSAALRLAGFDASTPDPDNGIIERLPGGEPSGFLVEGPAFILDRQLPFTVAQALEGLRYFQKDVAGPLGITTAHDSSVILTSPEADAYTELRDGGRASFRAAVSWWIFDDRPLAEQIEAAVAGRDHLAGPLLQARTAKFFADGVIEGYSGYLHEPYLDRPGFRGSPVWRPEALCAAATAAAQAGLQLHIHAIGDAAVSLALDAIEAAQSATGAVGAGRPLITHLQLVKAADLDRMGAAGVVALPQPYWFDNGEYLERVYVPKLGTERAQHQYPMKSFWDRGIVAASASDYPVSPPPDPLLGIQTGVLRTDPRFGGDSNTLWPEERVTVEQMIESFTINGAYANFLEDETGSLEVGKAADLVVLSRDILSCPPEEITEAEVELTVFGGRAVFCGGPFTGLAGQ